MTRLSEVIHSDYLALGVEYEIADQTGHMAHWNGLRVIPEQRDIDDVWLRPQSNRPDGHGRSPFVWCHGGLRQVLPDAPDKENLVANLVDAVAELREAGYTVTCIVEKVEREEI